MTHIQTDRDTMECDVLIVGAGPAGLSAAIHLKQLAQENNQEISVIVLEKAAEVGAHVLSGAVIDPVGLNALFPDWQKDGDMPLQTPVKKDSFYVLFKKRALRIPNFLLPPFLHNHGNYIGSLGNVCRWLRKKAEDLGAEIYEGFTASELVYDDNQAVIGVTTGDMGIDKSGNKKNSYEPGINLLAKYVLLAEGARGSLSKKVIEKFKLDSDSEPQKYGIGLKEVWEVNPDKHIPGFVQHSFGWPLDARTGGGGFLYHFDKNLVSVGFVVHLNYENPYLSPFDEFQRYKTHPKIRHLLQDGKRLSYGARAVCEGGYQSIPRLIFAGGALIGCSAGFVNVPRIKGSHNAILSGMLAAKAALSALKQGRKHDELCEYQDTFPQSLIAKDLRPVRNVKPLWSKLGTWLGIMIGGADMWMNYLKIGLPITCKHHKSDYECTKKASDFEPIDYPKPDGVVSFDKTSSVFLSGTNHEEDQPVHLHLSDPNIPINKNLPLYAEPAQRYCPAGVYEILSDTNGNPYFHINAQNCIHCKTCDIKDPAQNITWKTPEGAGGPLYNNM